MDSKIKVFYQIGNKTIGTEEYSSINEIFLPYVDDYKTIIYKSFQNEENKKWEIKEKKIKDNMFYIKINKFNNLKCIETPLSITLKNDSLKKFIKKGKIVEVDFGNLHISFKKNKENYSRFFNSKNYDVKDREEIYKRRFAVLVDVKEDYSLIIPITSQNRSSEQKSLLELNKKHSKNIYNLDENKSSYLLVNKVTTISNTRILPPIIKKEVRGHFVYERNQSYPNQLDKSELKKMDELLLRKTSINEIFLRNEKTEKELKNKIIEEKELSKKMLFMLEKLSGCNLKTKEGVNEFFELTNNDFDNVFFDEKEIYDILKLKR